MSDTVPPSSMPYGAPELKAVARRYLVRATVASGGLWIVFFFATFVLSIVLVHHVQRTKTISVPYNLLPSPPPLNRVEPPPQIAVTQPVAKVTAGVPVPVPDVKAPDEQTIASQQELQTPGPGSGITGDGIVVAPPENEDLPKLGEYVYTEELPEAINCPEPVYPEIAREAQVEGRVLVHILVGKDGRVLNAVVNPERSIPMLDNAALDAARKCVFKPALANNKPVPVWVAKPYHFRLH